MLLDLSVDKVEELESTQKKAFPVAPFLLIEGRGGGGGLCSIGQAPLPVAPSGFPPPPVAPNIMNRKSNQALSLHVTNRQLGSQMPVWRIDLRGWIFVRIVCSTDLI